MSCQYTAHGHRWAPLCVRLVLVAVVMMMPSMQGVLCWVPGGWFHREIGGPVPDFAGGDPVVPEPGLTLPWGAFWCRLEGCTWECGVYSVLPAHL